MKYRSVLFVPGHEEKKIKKAYTLDADLVVIDLESTVPDNEKKNARKIIKNCNVDKKYRSKSNIVFNFLKDEQNKKFVDAAKDIGIIGINGHRSVGGIRVSLFNSVDEDMFKFFMKFFKNYISELSN